MLIEIDFRSPLPIYAQIVERIKHLVATDALQVGEQLPTVRQLAADLRVNFNTVARAYRILDEAGVISTQQGRGTYVLEPMPAEQSQKLREVALDSLVRNFLVDADRLGFDPEMIRRATDGLIERWQEDGEPPQDGD